MDQTPVTQPTRRSFLVMLAGTVLGTYFLPSLKPLAKIKTPPAAQVCRLLDVPVKRSLGSGRYLLVWMENTDDEGVVLMNWKPETPEEFAESRRFYEDCRGYHTPLDLTLPVPTRTPGEVPLVRAMIDQMIRGDGVYDPRPFLEWAALRERRGDPAGEYVRISTQIDQLPDDTPEVGALDKRWRELQDTYVPGVMIPPLTGLGFRFETFGTFYPEEYISTQGLIEILDVERPGVIPEQAERLFAFAPALHKLDFKYDCIDLPGLAACKQMSQITSLRFSMVGVELPGIEALLQSPYLGRLQDLEISWDELGPGLGKALAQSSVLGQLRSLDIHGNALHSEGLTPLVTNRKCGGLKELRIGKNHLDATSMLALAASPHFQRLEVLSLSENPIGDEGLTNFCKAAFLPKLVRLELNKCALKEKAGQILANSEFHRLESLAIDKNAWTTTGIQDLLASEHLFSLRDLSIDESSLTDDTVASIANSPLLKNLRSLSLEFNQIGVLGATALAKSPYLTKLEVLALTANELDDDAIEALCESPFLANMRVLKLSGNPITSSGAMAICKSPYLKNLKELYIDKTSIGDARQRLIDRFTEGNVTFGD